MCEAFGCIPNVALQLDPKLVFAIMDYRSAKAARDLHNQDAKEFAKHPNLVSLWREMFTTEIGDDN